MWGKKKYNKYGNKKITKYNLKFDSKIELFFYELLLANKIPFEFQVSYTLQDKFKRNGNTVRSIKMIVDFVIKKGDKVFIVDTKGIITPVAKLKFKLLEYKLFKENLNFDIYLPNSQNKCREVIKTILDYE